MIEERKLTTMEHIRKHNAKLAARHEEHWKSQIAKNMLTPEVKNHPCRPWQEELEDKLNEPCSDREVIFVVDLVGKAGKSWFRKQWEQKKWQILHSWC